MDNTFLTTSEFVDKLNECIRSTFEDELKKPVRSGEDESSEYFYPNTIPQFELRSRFSDGTTRRLHHSEQKYADYRFKIGQVRILEYLKITFQWIAPCHHTYYNTLL